MVRELAMGKRYDRDKRILQIKSVRGSYMDFLASFNHNIENGIKTKNDINFLDKNIHTNVFDECHLQVYKILKISKKCIQFVIFNLLFAS